jgi:acetyl esterase/lipase
LRISVASGETRGEKEVRIELDCWRGQRSAWYKADDRSPSSEPTVSLHSSTLSDTMATFDPAHPRFQGFDLIQATYKHVGDHAVRVDVLVPQTLETGKRPTIVRFHGGGLVHTLVRSYYQYR